MSAAWSSGFPFLSVHVMAVSTAGFVPLQPPPETSSAMRTGPLSTFELQGFEGIASPMPAHTGVATSIHATSQAERRLMTQSPLWYSVPRVIFTPLVAPGPTVVTPVARLLTSINVTSHTARALLTPLFEPAGPAVRMRRDPTGATCGPPMIVPTYGDGNVTPPVTKAAEPPGNTPQTVACPAGAPAAVNISTMTSIGPSSPGVVLPRCVHTTIVSAHPDPASGQAGPPASVPTSLAMNRVTIGNPLEQGFAGGSVSSGPCAKLGTAAKSQTIGIAKDPRITLSFSPGDA